MAMTTSQRAKMSKTIQIVLFVVIIVVLALAVDWPRTQQAFFAFDKLSPMFPDIIVVGLKNTLFYTIISFAFGLVLGLVLALMKLASFAPYRWIATAIIEFFRGIPAILVLLAFGFGLPTAFGSSWPQPVNVMCALGLVSAAYIAETLRAGLQAVPKGQVEAARSLGMPAWRAMVTIVIPQAFKIVLPPMTNEIILLTKDSSLAFILGMAITQYELTKFGRDGMSAIDAGMTPLVMAGLFYLCITIPLSLVARKFESRSARTKR
ncbi:amino acid ABC transporter permease [Glutamicibacter sp.]|uniref:amino acid ABC transporter permease n=1 Tax=Glutamicibacter sp. TaxID=1931995 RepID=UPI0028BEDE54|nr:amino acid ABC transporter permease [Glutamicibacter sp.]